MLKTILESLRGATVYGVYLLNTVFWCLPIYALALAKALLRGPAWQGRCSAGLLWLADGWIGGTRLITRLTQSIDWQVRCDAGIERKNWYLVVANHQSWVDLIVLLMVLGRRISFPKIFAKQQMLWVPLLGVALWALEFPLMRRYPKEVLEKHPELRGRDLEAARRAFTAHRGRPISIVSFLEGTRFTAAKHQDQQSPYRHLLKPKAGGVALALGALDDKIEAVVDLTIVYPDGVPSFWDFLRGRLQRVRVDVRRLAVPDDLPRSGYSDDPGVRERFGQWVGELWRDKDTLIDQLRG
ncbi:acyltransferase [Desulfuromonas versatilis]|uniref:Acyltransferase n=1 Tax=Desulfuromonas versatilis TaxID=2802975 RepID=A0ABM8HXZ2_9BACT|nr:acyltransferase [Desulfuromonas versatilis]BCR05976.1 acyltransferase [Desulfuromonas versatilis]